MVIGRGITLQQIIMVLFIDLVLTAAGITFLAYNNIAIRETEAQNGEIIKLVIRNQEAIKANQATIKAVQNETRTAVLSLHEHMDETEKSFHVMGDNHNETVDMIQNRTLEIEHANNATSHR